MKKIAIVLTVLLQWCICIDLHSSAYKIPAGVYSGTRACAEVLAIPFRDYKGTAAAWVRAHTIITYPLLLADLPLEAVADTLTLPYDMYAADRERKQKHDTETRQD